jgi:hypothetical protein
MKRKKPAKSARRSARATQKPEPEFLSIPALAKRFGRNRTVVYDLLRDVPAAAMDGDSRLYRPSEVVELIETSGWMPVGIRKELIAEQIRKLKLANDVRESQLVEINAVRATITEVASGVKAILRRFELEFPVTAAGQPVAELRVLCRQTADALQGGFQHLSSCWDACWDVKENRKP